MIRTLGFDVGVSLDMAPDHTMTFTNESRQDTMIIVSGHVRTDPAERDSYVAECLAVVEQARRAAGCVDFHISADALEPDRINIYEQWESVADVGAFRGAGPSGEQQAAILDAAVYQHAVESSERL